MADAEAKDKPAEVDDAESEMNKAKFNKVCPSVLKGEPCWAQSKGKICHYAIHERVAEKVPAGNCNVYVCHLPLTTTKEQLEAIFSPYGEISECKLLVDPKTKEAKGVAFVHFKKPEAATAAIESIQGLVLSGQDKALECRLAKPNVKQGTLQAGAKMPPKRMAPYTSMRRLGGLDRPEARSYGPPRRSPEFYEDLSPREYYEDVSDYRYGPERSRRPLSPNRASPYAPGGYSPPRRARSLRGYDPIDRYEPDLDYRESRHPPRYDPYLEYDDSYRSERLGYRLPERGPERLSGEGGPERTGGFRTTVYHSVYDPYATAPRGAAPGPEFTTIMPAVTLPATKLMGHK